MRELLEIVNELKVDSSKSGKERIIKSNLYNKLFVEVMQFLLNPYILSGLSDKKLNKIVDINLTDGSGITTITGIMNYLKLNNTGKDYDIAVCQNFLSTIDDEEVIDMVKQIITKSLKVGVDSLWNKSVPVDLKVPEFSVLLAKSYDDYVGKIDNELANGFVITKKLDGLRMVSIIDAEGEVKFFTRQGKEYEGLNQIADDIAKLNLKSMVLDGEIMADVEGTNNEIFAETSSKARNKDKDKTGLIYNVFEILPLDEFKNGKSKKNTIDRKEYLHSLLSSADLSHIKEVKMLYKGNDISQIEVWGKYATDNEWEGCMVSLNKPYECKRSSSLLKLKKFKIADCLCLDLVEGGGKYVGKLGAIVIQFKVGEELHACECGSGFMDSERELYWNNPEFIKNKIVEINYFEISQNKNLGFGLRFPTWNGRIRDDKTEISMY